MCLRQTIILALHRNCGVSLVWSLTGGAASQQRSASNGVWIQAAVCRNERSLDETR